MNQRISTRKFSEMARNGEKIVMLTCYDASFAAVMEGAGVEILLIGDSLGMVVQGHNSTLPVTMEQMVYHTQCVARGSQRAMVLADLPFGSYQESPQQAFRNAAQLMAAGAQMVKLEGGESMAATVEFLTSRGIPVCSHLGLTPQSVHQLGGYRVQGRGEAEQARMLEESRMHQEAGASMLLFEAVPRELAGRITAVLAIPTIGIGAGVDCSGQVLVMHDMLDVFPGKKARFVRNFMQGAGSVGEAVAAYVKAVKDKSFPALEHTFSVQPG
ncbi:MAG TPA: 3-methyl-2-oxobutanoate hydroxymethyltransferase [Burkholderiales bacterium]|jgi:3-methyl-2-oxobutanoate hydroxymethyltransferase|nr:3-methyl-2-oxobutanoate hydroxymethyltransferase [Burkholderiales bacterium]